MSTQLAQPHEQEQVQFAPLDNELTFHVTATIAGVTGMLEIKAQRVSTIARTINLLKQNGLLTEQPTSSTEPLCPVHHKPMKPSKKPGAWFCSAKVGEGYCEQKVG